ALLLDRVTDQLRRLRKYMRIIEIVSGLLLIAVGVLVFSGAMQRLLAPLAGNTDLTIAIDRWLVNLVGGGERLRHPGIRPRIGAQMGKARCAPCCYTMRVIESINEPRLRQRGKK